MNFYVVPFKVIPLRYNTLVPPFFPILDALLICTFRFLSPQSCQNAVLSWVSSILGTGKSHRGLNLVNTVAEVWLRCFFVAKKLRTSNDEWAGALSQFWNELRCHTLQTQNIRKNCMARAKRYADILSNFSNSDSTILYNNFLHCFSVFIGCWRAGPSRASVVIHFFSTFCEELVPLVNTFLTYSTLTVCHFQHFKWFSALNSTFYTKFDAYSLIHFFRQRKIGNTRKTRLTFMPLTNKQKMLYCWNCEHTFGTSVPTWGKKIENRMYMAREI